MYKNILGLRKSYVQKSVGYKKVFSKNFVSKKIWFQKIVDKNKLLCPKRFDSIKKNWFKKQDRFGPNKCYLDKYLTHIGSSNSCKFRLRSKFQLS